MVRKFSNLGIVVNLGMVTTGATAPSALMLFDGTWARSDAFAPPANSWQRSRHEMGNRCGTRHARSLRESAVRRGVARKVFKMPSKNKVTRGLHAESFL